MTTSTKKPAAKSMQHSKPYTGTDQELNTQMPLSEKDEVKRAEKKMNKVAKPPAK